MSRVVSDPEPRHCPVCSLTIPADTHELAIVRPVEAFLNSDRPERTGPDDWMRVSRERRMRLGQYADAAIFPEPDNSREVAILDARVAHLKFLLAVEAMQVVVPVRVEAVA